MNPDKLETMQEKICRKYGAGFAQVDLELMIGVSDNLGSKTMSINGLRHSRHEHTTGWYIWSGELSNDKKFFKPMHVHHFIEKYPVIAVYLGLAPGWRFQIDPEAQYEDVWFDSTLLIDE